MKLIEEVLSQSELIASTCKPCPSLPEISTPATASDAAASREASDDEPRRNGRRPCARTAGAAWDAASWQRRHSFFVTKEDTALPLASKAPQLPLRRRLAETHHSATVRLDGEDPVGDGVVLPVQLEHELQLLEARQTKGHPKRRTESGSAERQLRKHPFPSICLCRIYDHDASAAVAAQAFRLHSHASRPRQSQGFLLRCGHISYNLCGYRSLYTHTVKITRSLGRTALPLDSRCTLFDVLLLYWLGARRRGLGPEAGP